MSQYVYEPEDLINPIFCTACRLHIPRAVSTAGSGRCPSCIQSHLGIGAPTTRLVPPPPIRWADALFASIAIIDVLRSLSMMVPAMFAALMSDAMSQTNFTSATRMQPQVNPSADRITSLLFLAQIAYTLLTCGAVGTLAGQRWGYLTTLAVTIMLMLVLLIQIATSDTGQKSQMVFSIIVYASLCCYAVVQLATRRYRP